MSGAGSSRRESGAEARAPAPVPSATADPEEDLVSCAGDPEADPVACAAGDPEADLSPATGHMGYSPNFAPFASFYSLFSSPFSPVASTQDSCMPLDELVNK